MLELSLLRYLSTWEYDEIPFVQKEFDKITLPELCFLFSSTYLLYSSKYNTKN